LTEKGDPLNAEEYIVKALKLAPQDKIIKELHTKIMLKVDEAKVEEVKEEEKPK
jgi:hypothetical protein